MSHWVCVVYVCVSVPYVEGGWFCFYYAFGAFIIFPRLLINCNADHNNPIHKYGCEHATRFLFTPRCAKRQNDKWILFSHAEQIGTQSGKWKFSLLFFFPLHYNMSKKKIHFTYIMRYVHAWKTKREHQVYLARNWIRPNCIAACVHLSKKSLLPYISWRLQINCYIAKHNKWKCCYWLYAKLSIHRGNIMELNHGAQLFFCTFASGISHFSVALHTRFRIIVANERVKKRATEREKKQDKLKSCKNSMNENWLRWWSQTTDTQRAHTKREREWNTHWQNWAAVM